MDACPENRERLGFDAPPTYEQLCEKGREVVQVVMK